MGELRYQEREHHLYDAAYEAYITDRKFLILSTRFVEPERWPSNSTVIPKTAGFTGVRCGYTIVPKELKAKTLTGEEVALNPIWDRRQCTKFNGTSYISQRAAEAIYTPEGKEQVKVNHQLLYGECPLHESRTPETRLESIWR